jgi:hypothetical protein
MSRRISIAALLALTLAAQPVFADFSRVARGLHRLGFERTWVPFLGLARSFVRVVHPKGVYDFQVAMYENTPSVSGIEIEKMLKKSVGHGFMPLVRVYSSRKGESVFVYARPSNDVRKIELLVLSHEPGETVLVRISADAEIVGRQLGMPEKIGQMASASR